MQSMNKKKCTYQHNYNGKFWVEVHGSWYRGIINILKMIHFGVEVHGSFFFTCVCELQLHADLLLHFSFFLLFFGCGS